MKWTTLSLAALSVFLSSCATTSEVGAPIEQSQISQISKGKTTKQDITAVFGKPTQTTVDSSGNEAWTYVRFTSTGRVKAATFIPVVGLFAGGATGESTNQSLIVKFKNDVVLDYAYSSGSSSTDYSTLGGIKTR